MEYYIYVLIFAVIIISIATLLTIGLVLWWLYDNFPFKYIKLDNSFVDTIDELQQDIYEYFDEEAERE
jgi:hypothetical protein